MSGSDTVATLLAGATTRLATLLALDKREARIEARVLLAHALKVDHAWLIAHDRDIPAGAQRDAIASLIERRAGGEPIAYIVGEREFFGRPFKVTPEVLIPRPETELLVEAALHQFPTDRIAHILDLGTGSGCIAITLALEAPAWRITAVDINPGALEVAADSAANLGAQVEWLRSDWFSALAGRRFDLIVGNPPYIATGDPHLDLGDLRSEPPQALASGTDGLQAIRHIVSQAGDFLEPGGVLMLEHGWDQGEAVQTLLTNTGYRSTRWLADLAGVRRIAIGGDFSSHVHSKTTVKLPHP